MALPRLQASLPLKVSVVVSFFLAFWLVFCPPEAYATPLRDRPLVPPHLANSRFVSPLALSQVPTYSSTPQGLSPETIDADDTVIIDGSSEMSVINDALKAKFEGDYPEVEVTIQSNGTEAALDSLLKDEIDLAAIGRPLTAAEKAKGLIEIPVSQDAISIIIGRNNDFDGHLTLEQLAQIFRGDITNWSEVGGNTQPIRFIDRPESSDTRLILSRYGVLDERDSDEGNTAAEPREGETHERAQIVQIDTDDTAKVIQQLGKDGIGYAIANQVQDQTKVKLVKIAILMDTLPNEASYPYSQIRGYAYRRGNAEAVQPFINFANGDTGKSAVVAAKAAEAQAVNLALQPRLPSSGADGNSFKGFPIWLWGLLGLPLLLLIPLIRKRSEVTPTDVASTGTARTDIVPTDIASRVNEGLSTSTQPMAETVADAAENLANAGGDASVAEMGKTIATDAASELVPETRGLIEEEAENSVGTNAVPADAAVESQDLTEAVTDVSALGTEVPESSVAEAIATDEDIQGRTQSPQDITQESITETTVVDKPDETPDEEGTTIADEATVDSETAIATETTIATETAEQAEVQNYYDQGWQLIGAQKYGEAVTAFERVLSLDPSWMLAWIGKGTALLNFGQYEQAIASFDYAMPWLREQDVDLIPGGLLFIATTWINRGRANLNFAQPTAALMDFDRALQLNNLLGDAWKGRGDALYRLDRSKEGDDAYAQAARLLKGEETEATEATPQWPQDLPEDDSDAAVLPLMDMVIVVDTSAPLQPQVREMAQVIDGAIATTVAERPTNIRVTWLGTEQTWSDTPVQATISQYLVTKSQQGEAASSSSSSSTKASPAILLNRLIEQLDWRAGAAQSLFYLGRTPLTEPGEQRETTFDQLMQTVKQTGTTVSTYWFTDASRTLKANEQATGLKEFTQMASTSGGLAFRSDENPGSFQHILEQALEFSCRQCLYRRLSVQSRQSAYVLDHNQMAQLQTPENSTILEPGSYILRINSGSFSYWTENPQFDPEPWVILCLYGGRVINQSTNVEVGATWATLNGYDDALKIKVLENTHLCALFMDTYKADNSGQIILSVLKAE